MADELKACPGCGKAGMETPERLESMFRAGSPRLYGCVHCGIYTGTAAAWNALPRDDGPAAREVHFFGITGVRHVSPDVAVDAEIGREDEPELAVCPECKGEPERFGLHVVGCDRCSKYKASHKEWNRYAMPEVTPEQSTFATGAVRSTDANGVRYDLISTVGLRRLAETYAEGARKYGPDNWRKGFPFSDLINHLQKHVEMFKAGDTSEDHLAHAAWGLFTLMDFQESMPEMDDRYKREATP